MKESGKEAVLLIYVQVFCENYYFKENGTNVKNLESLNKNFYVQQGEVGEREQKKDSEESRENNSLKILIKNIQK